MGHAPNGANRRSFTVNKARIRRLWEEELHQRNLAVADELLTPDAIIHDALPERTRERPERVKQGLHLPTAAFPDHHTTLEDVIATTRAES